MEDEQKNTKRVHTPAKTSPTLLPGPHREIVQYHMAGLTAEEICATTGVGTNLVTTVLNSPAAKLFQTQLLAVRAARRDRLQIQMEEAAEECLEHLLEAARSPKLKVAERIKLLDRLATWCPGLGMQHAKKHQVEKVSVVLNNDAVANVNARAKTLGRAMARDVTSVEGETTG